jgi:E3 ubiquitin-protein ligase TRIP12
VEEYVREVIDVVIGRGVQNQVQAFRTGFSKVFAVTDLQSFSSEELDLLFGNADEDWSTESKCSFERVVWQINDIFD